MRGVYGHELLLETRGGLRSGVIGVIFAGLTLYLLMVLTNAAYLMQLGAADIPRNSPSLVYQMTSGDAFFLLFAWAWVFALPVTRDRSAELVEMVLAAPVSARRLMLARFGGACVVAIVLGSSQMAGFLLAPVLEWTHMAPAGSMGPPPWAALGWAWLILTVPSALGCGALYLTAALRTRSVVGPFAMASLLMLCWMVAMIIMKGGHMDPFWATVLDPSGFAEAETQALHWTPAEKTHALLALTPALLLNRLVWCVLPLGVLAVTLLRLRREALLAREKKPPRVRRSAHAVATVAVDAAQAFVPMRPSWLVACITECGWQLRRMLGQRSLWLMASGLLVICVGGGFVHVVAHAEGPIAPRPELLAPVLMQMMFLLIAFVVAATAGLVARRDEVAGLVEMFDATPGPGWVRFAGRVTAVATMTLALCLVPAVAGLLVTALVVPQALSVSVSAGYPLLVTFPALFEMAAVMVLVHALVRRAGIAHALSMFAAFVMVGNHELELVSYPPYEIGIPLHLALSGLTGWAPWRAPVLAMLAFKLAVALAVLALAAVASQRSRTDGALRQWLRGRVAALRGPIGACLLVAVLVVGYLLPVLHRHFVDEGGYQPKALAERDDADFERTLQAAPFAVAGGDLVLSLDAASRQGHGRWTLDGLRAGKTLALTLPDAVHDVRASIDGAPLAVHEGNSAAAVAMPACTPCRLQLEWTIDARGWNAEGEAPRVDASGVFATAAQLAPVLGADPRRILQSPAMRKRQGLPAQPPALAWDSLRTVDAIAPAGNWRWEVTLDGNTQRGQSSDALDFAVTDARNAVRTDVGAMALYTDATRASLATGIADDISSMQACLQRRTGLQVAVERVVQLPRDAGDTQLVGGTLLLAEAPSLDIQGRGAGRDIRQRDIATALLRAALVARTGVREGSGAAVLAEGLPGGVSLACVGDVAGVESLTAMLGRDADTALQRMAASTRPVGAPAHAALDDWYGKAGPMALLPLAVTLDTAQVNALADAVHDNGGDALAALDGLAGWKQAIELPMRSADLDARGHGHAWQWQDGGWTPAAAPATQVLVRCGDRVQVEAGNDCGAQLRLPADGVMERAPADNLRKP